jgi:predicted RNA-binding Zn ribbon-like protein
VNSKVRKITAQRRPFDFGANHLALDFTNTVNGRPDFTRDDLSCSADIVEWAVAAEIVKHAEQVGGHTDSDLRISNSQFAGAIALRESLYEVFGPVAGGGTPTPKALAFVARRAAQAMRSAEWGRGNHGYVPQWPEVSVDAVCDRLADEAMQLLRSPLIDRVGSCAGCGWLFVDVSRAHARRWCSMNACGVRDKMRRYHQRQATATQVHTVPT